MLSGLDVICRQFVLSTWFITAATVTGCGALLWRRRARPHRWWRWSTCSAVVLVATLAASAISVNAYYAYLPTVGDALQAVSGDRQWLPADHIDRLSPAQLAHATTKGLTIRLPTPADPADGFRATTTIAYLPPQYFTHASARFPVVYLFHGSPGQPSDWFHAGDAAREGLAVAAAGHPAILVAPRMSRSWTDDPECVDGTKEKVESHLLHDVIPTVDSTFRTEPDRTGRIFAGMSAGGFCALNLGLRHRDVVATVIDMSGDTTPTHTGGADSLFGKHNPAAAAEVRFNSPADYAATLTPQPPMRIWLDSGSGDSDIVGQMSRLRRELAPHVAQLVWRVRPGGHTYWVWTAAMREALPWALGENVPASTKHSHPGP